MLDCHESRGVIGSGVEVCEGLAGDGEFRLLLVNAHQIKQVPRRKTDQKDSEWIADLLQHGLFKASFVPTQTIRRLRDLTRMRVKIRAGNRKRNCSK